MSSVKFNQEIISKTEKNLFQKLVSEQSFWVTIALFGICFIMFFVEDAFSSKDNLFNITRNFSFIGIMAIGMTFVIITAGIDLSVGSIMGVTGVICGLFLDAQFLPEWYSKASYFEGVYVWVSIILALLAGILIGAVNGYLIAYLKLSPFVVTLGMMAAARSLALVVSNNKMFYEFGPKDEMFYEIGGGSMLGLANATWLLIFLTIVMGLVLKYTSYGKHVFAVGSNKKAAELSGINIRWIEMSVYMISGLFAAISAVMIVGWMGSVTNALGYTYELRVIAATVIGGANLMGGVGGTFGAFIKIKSEIKNREALLQIGAAGPIAGFIIAIPSLIIGLKISDVYEKIDMQSALILGDSILMKLLIWFTHPNLLESQDIMLHPIAFAGWIGLLVTMLNLLPIGQLDGGHIAYAMFGRQQHWIARIALTALIPLSFISLNWLVWGILIVFLMRSANHPPIEDFDVPLSKKSIWVGYICFLIFILCFIPAPFKF